MKSVVYGFIAIIIGLALIFGALYWDAVSRQGTTAATAAVSTSTSNVNPIPHPPSERKHSELALVPVVIKLIETVGVTLFGIGLLNIILEMKDWRDYFEKRVRDLIMQQSYLNRLDKEALRNLQTNVLKAQFKDEKIDHEGSFLNYFHYNLHRYIAEPYREDVSAEVIFSEDGTDHWNIFDRVTYVCRRSASGIQSAVNWMADKDEYVSVQSLRVDVQYPYNHEKKGMQESIYPPKSEPNAIPEIGKRLSVPLDNYKEIDGLIIILTTQYKVQKDKFTYWTMAHPTKNFDITVTYPPGNSIQVKPLVINEDLVLRTEKPGYFKMKCDSWMLPASGLSWRIIPQKLAIPGPAGPP